MRLAREQVEVAELRRRRWKWRPWPYGVLLVFGSIFVVFNLIPLLRLFQLAFVRWSDVLAGRPLLPTLGNFQQLFADPIFWRAMQNTLAFTAIRVPLGLVLGLMVALAVQRSRVLRPIWTAAWFSPFMTSVVAMALVFNYLYNPTFGLFNHLLDLVGIPPQGFLRDPSQALISIAVVDLWKSVGFNVVVFMAGLAGVPDVYYEAAKIDGAGVWRTFTQVTLPLLSRTIYLLIIVGVITSMRVFVPIYVMSGFSLSSGGLGGPLNSTMVLTLYMYQSAFRFNEFGVAAASAVVLFVLVMVVTAFQFKVLRTKWEY